MKKKYPRVVLQGSYEGTTYRLVHVDQHVQKPFVCEQRYKDAAGGERWEVCDLESTKDLLKALGSIMAKKANRNWAR